MSTASIGAHTRRPVNRWQPARQGFAAWRHRTALKIRQASVHVVSERASIRKLALTATALGFLDAAAWDFKTIAGLAATGVSIALFNECMD